MSFLDRIKDCNGYDPRRFVPFLIDGVQLGLIHRDFTARLRDFPTVFEFQDEVIYLHSMLSDYAQRTAGVAAVVATLAEQGLIRGWYHEAYPVTRGFDLPASLEIERAAASYFGVRAFGVHINGYVERDGELWMWVARRARDKPSFPGMLDHLAAGGQPVGLGLLENVIKECAEEADVPEELSAGAVLKGQISYCREYKKRVRPDTMFIFDLKLPEDFKPCPADGEVESFELWPLQEVAETVKNTRRFKPNCNLVIIDFLIRHGLISTHHPDFDAVRLGLNTHLP